MSTEVSLEEQLQKANKAGRLLVEAIQKLHLQRSQEAWIFYSPNNKVLDLLETNEIVKQWSQKS